jgi:hypothetical protein
MAGILPSGLQMAGAYLSSLLCPVLPHWCKLEVSLVIISSVSYGVLQCRLCLLGMCEPLLQSHALKLVKPPGLCVSAGHAPQANLVCCHS